MTDTKEGSGALSGVHVLIVEDEPVVALDLAAAVEDAGGIAVGPATSLKRALELCATAHVEAAILDVDLLDGNTSQVLELLEPRGIPAIIHTGVALPREMAERFPDVPVFAKPSASATLARELHRLLQRRSRAN